MDHPNGAGQRCTLDLRFYQTLMEVDRETRFANRNRPRKLKHAEGDRITILCSHDEKELEALQGSHHHNHAQSQPVVTFQTSPA